MVLVTGPAGIGKSALVREVQSRILSKPAGHQRPYFISGKFDQLKRSIPYAPLIQAFHELIRQIFSESDKAIADWKAKLLKGLGPNGQVMIEVIPELELIIGEQPEVPIVGPVENVNRFNYVFENFIRTFAAKAHPLIIFLDDLQWADAASLKLIEMFITVKAEYLYLIGAYRDNEVDAAHPLMRAVDEIEKSGAKVVNIQLQLLKEAHLNQLLPETFSCDQERSKPLAGLCFLKTRGNPFFLKQFIDSLYRDGLIFFDGTYGIWQWDETKIKHTDVADNVVDLMVGKIQKLSEDNRVLLSLAACIGNRFDLSTLSIVYGKPVQETADRLLAALREELVLPVDESYKYVSEPFQSPTSETGSGYDPPSPVYKFLHDRVQQAAYSLIEEEERPKVHLQIGREMLKRIPKEELHEHLFNIVDQLNLGIELMTDEAEREKLAELNLFAGKRAKFSAAFGPAFDYFKFAIRMLKENRWEEQYDLNLTLFGETAEAAYLCGDFDEMDKLINMGLDRAKTLLDKVRFYEIRIIACTIQNKLLEAAENGLFVLNLLGVRFPEKPKMFHILLGLLRTKLTLVGKSTEKIINLPEMTDPYNLAKMRVFASMGYALFATAPKLVPLGVFEALNLSVKHGNAPESPFFYVSFGMILCGALHDIDSGHQFGQIGLNILERLNEKKVEIRTPFAFNHFIKHWKEHTRETLTPILRLSSKGFESGDLEWAGYAVEHYCHHSYLVGKRLTVLKQEMTKYNHLLAQIKQKTSLQYHEINQQAILNLMGHNLDSIRLIGECCDEEKMLPVFLEAKDGYGICNTHLSKLILCYLFCEYLEGIGISIFETKNPIFVAVVVLSVSKRTHYAGVIKRKN